MQQHAEKEIIKPTLLCDKKGNLNPTAIGYAKLPLFDGNLSGHFMKKKKWNSWYVYGEDIIFSVTISHYDYVAICTVFVFEYETQHFFEKTILLPLMNKVKMPTQILGSLIFSNNEMSIHIVYLQQETQLSVAIPNFENSPLHAKLIIEHPPQDETLNVVVPWNRQTFHLTAKHHTLPTKGIIKIGEKQFSFSNDESFAVLDVGRGILPKNFVRNWGMASQRIRGQRIGLNFGGKWTDGTGMTENAVFIDGKLFKIHEDILFEYNQQKLTATWKIYSKFTNSVQLTFSPFFERTATTNIKIMKSSIHQLFGYYNGTILLDNGETLIIKQLLGSVDRLIAKW